jgi:transposase
MPGPDPVYQPRFSADDLERVREIAQRRNAPHSAVVRASLALLLADQPEMSSPEAGRRLGLHEQSVRHWRKRWCGEGLVLEDRPRSGRPPKFSPC